MMLRCSDNLRSLCYLTPICKVVFYKISGILGDVGTDKFNGEFVSPAGKLLTQVLRGAGAETLRSENPALKA